MGSPPAPPQFLHAPSPTPLPQLSLHHRTSLVRAAVSSLGGHHTAQDPEGLGSCAQKRDIPKKQDENRKGLTDPHQEAGLGSEAFA